MCDRHPLHCILPPHVLEHVAQYGDDDQRRWARQNLVVSAQLRGFRMAASQHEVPFATGQKQRAIYHADSGFTLPGRLVRSEGATPTHDEAVDEAYDGLGDTYDLYHDEYGRNSLDDAGFRLVATVHYGDRYANAFWDGRQMTFGDGDGVHFLRFTRSLDVIGHELTHGVVEHTANLAYWEEPGALNESFSDVFGTLVKQRRLHQTAEQADWRIGAEIFGGELQGQAIRSLAAPGTAHDHPLLGRDPQPAHMDAYVHTNEDNGGVHINSGIPNHAFYLAARALGGHAWQRAGRIWYLALTTRLRRKSTFQDAANATFAVAGEQFGTGSLEQQAVHAGWEAVGLRPDVQPLKIVKLEERDPIPA